MSNKKLEDILIDFLEFDGGQFDAREISRNTGIRRSSIYGLLRRLEGQGKIIANRDTARITYRSASTDLGDFEAMSSATIRVLNKARGIGGHWAMLVAQSTV